MKKIPTFSDLLNKRQYRKHLAGAAILMGAIAGTLPQLFAGTLIYSGGSIFENFDLLGTGGTSTSTLTGNATDNGTSPWFVGTIAHDQAATTPVQTGNGPLTVSTGSVGIVSPGTLLFNNGEAGTNAISDRALGTGNTGFDPVIDLAIKNTTGAPLISFSVSYDTEWWRSGNSAGVADSGYLLYVSTNASTFANTGALQPTRTYFAAQSDLDGNAAANRQTVTVSYTFGTPVANNGTFYLRWADTNDATPSPDAQTAIDNFSFTAAGAGRNIIYNASHGVGGAPDGVLSTAGGNYFLLGGNPTAFSTNDTVTFSQNPTGSFANIAVPSNVATTALVVSNSTGTYQIGGAGRIAGALTKSGGGTLVLTSPNSFSSRTITGGTVESQADGALGVGAMTISGGALLNITQNPQTLGGAVALAGTATIQTDADFTITGISGAGQLVKTGDNSLIFATGASSSATGGIKIQGGVVQAETDTALGAVNQKIILDQAFSYPFGATLEFTHASGDITFNDTGTKTRTIEVTPNGGGLAVRNNATLTIGRANSITNPNGGGEIDVSGFGAVRLTAAQSTLSSDWVIYGGTVEVGAGVANALGSGTVTVRGGGLLAGGGSNTITNHVILRGGELGTRNSSSTVFSGQVDVLSSSKVALEDYAVPTNSLPVTISGKLTGSGKLTVRGNNPQVGTPNSSLNLTNNTNTFSGILQIDAAQIVVAQSTTGVGSVLGSAELDLNGGDPANVNPAILRIRDNGTASNGTLVYDNDVSVFSGDATIDVNRASGVNVNNTVEFNSFAMAVPSPTVIGNQQNQTLTFTQSSGYKVKFNGPADFTGDLGDNPNGQAILNVTTEVILQGGITGNFALTKTGSGKLTINGPGTSTAITRVTSGSLGGNGGVGGALAFSPGSTFSPGDTTGTFSVGGNLSLSTQFSTLAMDLSHGGALTPLPGVDYDQVIVGTGGDLANTGTVSLSSAKLTLTLGTGIQGGDLFFLIINDGTDAISGTFNGMADNSLFTVGAQQFRISYFADNTSGSFTGGNDVALRAIPEPASGILALSAAAALLGLRRRRL